MPYYDLSAEDVEITLEKVLENYKYLEYITHKQWKENPSSELYRERLTLRNIISMLERVIRKRNESKTMFSTI